MAADSCNCIWHVWHDLLPWLTFGGAARRNLITARGDCVGGSRWRTPIPSHMAADTCNCVRGGVGAIEASGQMWSWVLEESLGYFPFWIADGADAIPATGDCGRGTWYKGGRLFFLTRYPCTNDNPMLAHRFWVGRGKNNHILPLLSAPPHTLWDNSGDNGQAQVPSS